MSMLTTSDRGTARIAKGLFSAGVALAALWLVTSTASAATTLIVHARLVDGTGAPARAAAVRMEGAHVVAVGDLAPAPGEEVVDARGLVLAPGFIDTHSHFDSDRFASRDMAPLLAQGVTTFVVGNDGFSGMGSFAETAAALAAAPISVNVASYTGHGTLRAAVMGPDYRRAATPDEIRRMGDLLARDMAAGSLGLSTGLEYDPGIYSTHEEVLQLAAVAAAAGGRYISHMRSEDVRFDAALDELLDIGRKTGMPVQVSHMKLAMVDRWGGAAAVLARLDRARAQGVRVTADVYPYEYWQSTLTVMLPERDFTDRKAARFALTHLTTPQGAIIGAFLPDPQVVGKTIAEVAAARHEDPVETYLSLIQQSQAWEKTHADDPRVRAGAPVESVIATSMASADVAAFIAWPNANICSDGALGSLHPRGAGTFARILRQYVREDHLLTLETAIHKMTELAAEHVGLADRGVIRPGAFADLVLFDPDSIADHATPATPGAPATGVERVWVNGELVYSAGQATHRRAGRFLTRGIDANTGTSPKATAEAQTAIRALRLASNAAIAARDPVGTLASMSPDITLIDSAGTVFKGAKLLVDDYASHEFQDPAFISYDRVTDRVEVGAGGERAAEFGRWTGRYRQAGGGERQRSGVYLAEWVKSDGAWKVRAETYVGLGCGAMAACHR